MNILLTCAGRRNYLVSFFKEALSGSGSVLAADADSSAPALQEADKSFLVPNVDHPEYVSTVVSICETHRVKLLISLNDLELPILAAAADKFIGQGVFPVVSSPAVIEKCFDKWSTCQFVVGLDLKAPKTFLTLPDAVNAIQDGLLSFPLVVKPRWGSASIGIVYPEDIDELQWAYHLVKRQVHRSILASASATDSDRSVLIQEKIVGSEYGLDIVNDLDGNYVTTFVKRKLSMRAGETDRAVTETAPELAALGERIGRELRHIGNLDCDVLIGERGPIVLELNPRFGGGYPFSHIAGANLPKALLAWITGETPDASWLQVKPGVTAAKCDRLVVKTFSS